MRFSEKLKELFREARNAAISNDYTLCSAKLRELACFFGEVYKINTLKLNEKAIIRMYFDKFLNLSAVIKKSGVNSEVASFFGIDSSSKLTNIDDYNDDFIGRLIAEESSKPFDNDSKPKQISDVEIDSIIEESISKDEKSVNNEGSNDEKSQQSDLVPETQSILQATNPAFEPTSLDSFIGQTETVARIKQELKAAKLRGVSYLDHIMLFGGRGLGKSTLMKLIAKELGAAFEFLDCAQFRGDVASQRAVQKFLQNISTKYNGAPVVIAFDEIGFCSQIIQSSLLTLLNDRNYTWLDNKGVTHCVKIENFTFIGATTDPQDLLPTLKDRCLNLTFYLRDYTREELSLIFKNKFSVLGYNTELGALEMCVNRCRSSIREVNAFVKGLQSFATINYTTCITIDLATEFFIQSDIDDVGLNKKDREILKVLCYEQPNGISANNLATLVGVSVQVLTSEYEPFLIKNGYLLITSKGRVLTEKAKAYLENKN